MTRAPDVAVIGGGILGTSTAALLGQSGATVRLYERSAIGAGASGRNSGIVQHPFDRVLADLHHRTLTAYRALGAALAGAFALPAGPAGLLLVGRDGPTAEAAAHLWSETWPDTAPAVLAGAQLHELEPALAPGLVACRLAIGYLVEPAAATQAFATLAERSGAEIRVGSAATVAVERGRATGVLVDGALEPAGEVVVAAGPWTSTVIDPTGTWHPIAPVWGVVASIGLEVAPRHGLEAIDIGVEPGAPGNRGEAATPDPSEADAGARDADVDFSLVPSAGSSALGSTFLAAEPEPAEWVETLRRVGARYVPGVAAAPLLGLRHCARPASLDGRPLVGRVPWTDRLWVIAGHGPWGISTGPGSAQLLVDEILGRAPAVRDALAVGRFGSPAAILPE